ncbi:MAG: lipid IV(A) 3-deoxy-D-manno-octulosonic acid transferase [Proteobacteria bacterium]|nr:lipid IV(A) 3-deoxy-D-manno-octulosonic acid transferase [Pseudomonadota bacterium]
MTLSRAAYSLLVFLALPAIVLRLLWRARRQPEYLRHWGERFSCYADSLAPAERERIIWIHAVSVGETRAAQTLIVALRERYPDHRILLTHMTPTGRETGVALFGESVDRVYLPYDYPWAVARFLRHFKPRLGLIIETELWPNLIHLCRIHSIPLLLVNARMSDKSARRYARFPQFSRSVLQGLTAIAAQEEEDARRLRRLGAANVLVLGNLKFDIAPPLEQLARGRAFRQLFGERPVMLAASTRAGEEALLLDAWSARREHGPLLVIVPRHPQRFAEVAGLITTRGLRLQRRSEAAAVAPETQVWLGDSMGEMFAYYAAGDVAFIGGSLLDYGSQNLIEGCAVGVPLLLGPSTFNFSEAARAALACGAARAVADANELVNVALALLADAEERRRMGTAGEAFAVRHRGASERTLALLENALAASLPPAVLATPASRSLH